MMTSAAFLEPVDVSERFGPRYCDHDIPSNVSKIIPVDLWEECILMINDTSRASFNPSLRELLLERLRLKNSKSKTSPQARWNAKIGRLLEVLNKLTGNCGVTFDLVTVKGSVGKNANPFQIRVSTNVHRIGCPECHDSSSDIVY